MTVMQLIHCLSLMPPDAVVLFRGVEDERWCEAGGCADHGELAEMDPGEWRKEADVVRNNWQHLITRRCGVVSLTKEGDR